MNDQAVTQPGTVALEPPSTVLNPETVPSTSGGGVPNLADPAEGSVESVLEAELARLKGEDAKADKPEVKEEKPETKDDEKAEKEVKPDKGEKTEDKPQRQRSEDGKFAKAEKSEDAKPVQQAEQKGAPDEAATGQDGSERGRQSEGRQHYEPPARFLPKEREAWANVPNVVKSAIDRISREHDAEVQQYRTSHEEWTRLDKFQQMAKQHNTNVYDALDRYTRLDGLLQSDLPTAMREILATRGITPQQYAEHVLNNPDLHTAPRQTAPDPVVHQVSSEVVQLRQEIAAMKQEQAALTVVQPFRASHPRFDELQNDIALFLQSGKIPTSLSPAERLEAAYDMAERINPRSMSASQDTQSAPAAVVPDRPAKLDAGQKSIRGAPDDGSDTKIDDAEDEDLSKMLRKELRRISA